MLSEYLSLWSIVVMLLLNVNLKAQITLSMRKADECKE